jgi:non-reducing end alpha-L-arabinofuranosidase
MTFTMRKTNLNASVLPLLTGLGFAACSDAGGPGTTSSGTTANGAVGGVTTGAGTDGGPVTSGGEVSTISSGSVNTVTTGVTSSSASVSNAAVTTGTSGTTTGGDVTTNGTSAGGAGNTDGGVTNTDGAANTTGAATTGGGMVTEGPCDIYAAAGTPCVGAYSTIRRLSSTYTGPLYQVRSGSNAMNTGSGGQTHDIGQTADGFADAAAQDAVCQNTFCTISLMYDQSGRGNDLPVAKAGLSNGGQWAAMDDFESKADEDPRMVGGHKVYTLYMEARQGYRMTTRGDGVPRGQEPQGIYMLADGTHWGTACCWDFGNVTPNPKEYHEMNTLFFGTAFWGRGAGNGPWMMADFEAGVWAGGSNPGDPGWGSLDGAANAPANSNNPSLGVPFALGFLKTNQNNWALRMANLATATSITTAYAGGLPKRMDNQGAIVIGVGGDNSNNSWGTFYEGAVVAGFPSDEAEHAVMENLKSVGYSQ